MKERNIHVLSIVLMLGCVLCAGVFGHAWKRSVFLPPSSFELQEKYAEHLQDKLVSLLEPATGIGNVKASVQANIRHQNMTQTQLDFQDATRTVVHENGPVIATQSVSVLINGGNKKKLTTYQNLVKAAIGFDEKRGDQLAVEMLPFVDVPLWTFGLTPVTLVRIGAGLIVLILLGVFWLSKELFRQPKHISHKQPNEQLWRKIAELPASQLADLIKINRPELSAFILFRLPEEKASEIVELLPADYMNQVILHLDYIEKLSPADKEPLIWETEERLREMLRAVRLAPKTGVKVPQKEDNTFEVLKDWSDSDLQNLLHYVSKKELVKALQTASLGVQQALSRNIPPALWQSLIQQTQLTPCSQEESVKAQNKIMQLAKLLKEAV